MRKILLITAILATLPSVALASPIFKYKVYTPGITAGSLAGVQQIPEPESCELPWGGPLAHDTSVPAYSASTVSAPASCSSVAVTLSCTDGILSSPSAVESCQVADPYAGNVVLELDFSAGFANPQNRTVASSSGVTVANGVATFAGNSNLKFTASPDYIFPADFTIELRAMFSNRSTGWTTVSPSNQYLMDMGSNQSYINWRARTDVAGVEAPGWETGTSWATSGPRFHAVPAIGQWYDLAVARKNGVIGLFINNSLVATHTSATTWGVSSVLTIGNYRDSNGYGFVGDLDYLRITKGVSRFDF